MVREIKISGPKDIEELNEQATRNFNDIGVHCGSVIVDAKSLLGLLALDYSQRTLCVTEDDNAGFFKGIRNLLVEPKAAR